MDSSLRESGLIPHFRLQYAVWLFGIFAYFIPAATWNPVSRLSLTRALVEDHALMIDRYAESTGDRSFAHGHWYSDKAPLPAVLAVPAYALVRWIHARRGQSPEFHVVPRLESPGDTRVIVNACFAQLLYACSIVTAALAGAVLGVLVFEALRRRTTLLGAFLASLAAILGSPVMVYSTSFYGHTVAASFLFGAFLALTPPTENPAALLPSARRVRLAGACLALSVCSEYITFFPGFVIAAVFLVCAGYRRLARNLADLTLGAMLPTALLGAYHTACFGAPWRTGYSFIARKEFAAGHASGILGIHLPSSSALWGLLFGAERGLFWISPVLLVATVAGAAYTWRRRDQFSLSASLAALGLLLANSGYYMWWGGASAGPRHLVPAMSFCGLGFAAAWTHPRGRALCTSLLGISSLNVLALTAVGAEAPEGENILLHYILPSLLQGRISQLVGASNLGIRLGLPPVASLGPLLLWILLGLRSLVLRLREARSAEAAA